jgi:hypothetical protein
LARLCGFLIEAPCPAIFGFNVRDLLCQFLSAHSRGIITLILGDDRSAIISLLWASCLEVPKPDLDPQFGTRNRFTTRDSDCSPVAHHFLEVA